MLENQKSKVAGDATMIKTNNACSCGCCSQDLAQTKGFALSAIIKAKQQENIPKNSNYKENNPMGVCYHKIIQEAINKGLAMK